MFATKLSLVLNLVHTGYNYCKRQEMLLIDTFCFSSFKLVKMKVSLSNPKL